VKKMLYVVLDGLGDAPIKALKNRTPLEAAFTPNMDRIAQSGKSGMVHVVLARGAGGRLPVFPPVRKQHGITLGACVEGPVERGIALLMGMDVIDAPQRTGRWDVDYAGWVEVVLQKISAFDGPTIHIKGPDTSARGDDFKRKKECIEAIDKYFLGTLLPEIKMKESVIVVTAIQASSCLHKRHSVGPAPFVMAGAGASPDGTMSFSEHACSEGSLGEVAGRDVMGLILEAAQ